MSNRMTRLIGVAASTSLAIGVLAPAALAQSPAASMAAMPALPAPEKTAINIGLSVTETSQYAAQARRAGRHLGEVRHHPEHHRVRG